jgi:nicotinamidase-related amidase
VFSTVLDAVNIGLRVALVEDAVCSSSDAGHASSRSRARRTNEIGVKVIAAVRSCARFIARRWQLGNT